MSDENMTSALMAAEDARFLIMQELRTMAEGVGQYAQFASIDPWIRNIWHAAADLLEDKNA